MTGLTEVPAEGGGAASLEVTKHAVVREGWRWRATLAAIVILPIALAAAYVWSGYQVALARKGTCDAVNELRTDTRDFLHQSVDRAEKAAQALVESPNSTPEQRKVALGNLEELRKFTDRADARFADKAC